MHWHRAAVSRGTRQSAMAKFTLSGPLLPSFKPSEISIALAAMNIPLLTAEPNPESAISEAGDSDASDVSEADAEIITAPITQDLWDNNNEYVQGHQRGMVPGTYCYCCTRTHPAESFAGCEVCFRCYHCCHMDPCGPIAAATTATSSSEFVPEEEEEEEEESDPPPKRVLRPRTKKLG
eukprot:TRINITY_DN3985_c0_g1_i1.p1 TRINITY_DN3985_c0_g1~~TRINITY_DN3985_c0_g1_i1.p1  ORF type:complete len:179 (+),score=19.24 TRINITY_DN3985_c0_g1_i1:207-743(+)